MKKLLFFSVAIGLALSANAQVGSSISEPATIQKLSAEKATEMFLAPKEGNILQQKSNSDKPRHKANYESYGQISNMQYAAYNLGTDPSFGASSDPYVIRSSFSYLFPDSLAIQFQYDLNNNEYTQKLDLFASTGFVFDPYSFGYDRYGNKGLFRDSAGILLGYRLDTLWTFASYQIRDTNNNPAPDTLRFFISSYDIYKNRNDVGYEVLRYGDTTSTMLTINPLIDYANPIPEKGHNATKPQETDPPTTIVRDYYLTGIDSAAVPPNYYRLSEIGLPLLNNSGNGGYEIPAGSCLSVIVQYIPAYDYNKDDTLVVKTWHTGRPEDNQFVSEDIQHNFFGIRNWNFDTATRRYMFDHGGYNGSLHETMELRYGTDTNDYGRGKFYSSAYYAKPVFYMALSVTEDDTIHLPPVDPDAIVTRVENLVSNIYPNPATTELTVDLNSAGNANMTIYNLLGQAVLEETLSNMSNKVNISNLSQGMYVVKVRQDGKTHTVKMSKK
jgi:hypothetical protein